MVKENNHKYYINLIRKGLEHQYESSDMDTSIFESMNDLNLYNLEDLLPSPSQMVGNSPPCIFMDGS